MMRDVAVWIKAERFPLQIPARNSNLAFSFPQLGQVGAGRYG
jgi:hypothetical protein